MEPTTSIPYKDVKLLVHEIESDVFLAKRMDGREPEEIVVKKYILTAENQQNKIKLLTEEAKTLLELKHENVVLHLNTQLTISKPYDTYDVIMEYCTGGTLKNAVKKGGMSCVLLQKWLREIVSGLAYIHEMGVVHRDLKCENIFLSDRNFDYAVVKIGDFGELKKLLGKYTKSGEVSGGKGTPLFMSPEMIQEYTGNPRVNIGRKTDIWSLGCVVIEMITGAFPKFYYNNTRIALDNNGMIMYFIAAGGLPDIPANLSKELDAFITDCLTVDQESRPEAAALLNHSFLTMDVSAVVLPIRA